MDRLNAIGYVAGSQEPRTESVVSVHDVERAYAGLNFFTSGHAPVAYLVDMEGELVHRWFLDFLSIFPDREMDRAIAQYDYWRRAILMPDGSVIGLFDGLGIFRVDKDSSLMWAHFNEAHHDLAIRGEEIVVLTRTAHLVPRVHAQEPILEDFLTVMDLDGNELRSLSVLEAFENSEFKAIGLRTSARGGDIFHTNTVSVLEADGPTPWLKSGFILTSLRTPNVLAVIDPRAGRVVKAWTGAFNRQHDPQLEDGRILLFDNVGLQDQSRVMEIDPVDMSIAWEYLGDEDYPLRSWTCGTVQRLPNGNTLITESDHGRALEVTREGDTVWEYFNPFRVGTDPEYIATIFDMDRVPLGPPGWLN